jgi:hypothetical protein
MGPLLASHRHADLDGAGSCSRCCAPTNGEVCAFCRLVELADAYDPVAVELLSVGGRRR